MLQFETQNPYTVITPLSEIKAAIDAGRQVWFLHNTVHYPLVSYVLDRLSIFDTMNFGTDNNITYSYGAWSVT